ncbi:MAG: hypothetical protein Q7S18_02800 [bacterium]|nr:hypothetical protein [bacterium]
MKNFWREYKIYLAAAAYLLSVGAAYFFAIKPLILRTGEENDRIQGVISDQENRQERISKIPVFNDQFEKIKGEEDKIKISLAGDNVVELIKKIESISEATGNEVKIEVAPDQVNKKAPVKSKKDNDKASKNLVGNLPGEKYITISVTIQGDYESMMNFVRKLENMNYYSDIISFKIAKTKENLSLPSGSPFETAPSDAGIKNIDLEKNKITSTIIASFYLENK